MMSQNRQAEKDRLQAQQDYEINLMAEFEIRDLHDKLDSLRYKQWHELWHIQQRQLELLEHLHKELSHPEERTAEPRPWEDRKSTRLNSSHSQISYAVFCLK